MRSENRHAHQSGFHRPFTLSVTKALGDQLFAAFAELTPTKLTQDHLDQVQRRAGVYQLYLSEGLVYVGKADTSLRTRLANHLRKLQGRRGIDMGVVEFACLYVDEDFTALAPERLLIDHYRATGNVPWNTNGFGNKDPGKKRDQTAIKADHFDAIYRIDLDFRIDGLPDGQESLSEFMDAAKKRLPYTFRYGNLKEAANIQVASRAKMYAHDVLELIARAQPDGWQVVVLPGYVVSYADSGTDYPSATRVYTRSGWRDSEPAWSTSSNLESEPGFDEDAEVTLEIDGQ